MIAALTIDRLAKRFGNERAANGISMTIAHGEFVVVLGPSGSGKSTLLRLIAGLETPDSGSITLDGQDITSTPPYRRHCALVFQQYALLPHRTVHENIGFGLRMQGVDRQQAVRRIDALIERVGLGGQDEKRPHQLSGGQQQRVALARALAVEPAVLLLDEPFGALDLSLRRQLQDDLRDIQRQDGRTTIHVTHDQSEALALADRIVVMHRGEIAQAGSPQDIYEHPVNRFVAEFMDFRNLLPIAIRKAAGRYQAELADRPLRTTHPVPGEPAPMIAAIRPEHVTLSAGSLVGENMWGGIVRDVAYGGSTHVHTILLPDGTSLEAHSPGIYPVGADVTARLHPDHIVLLDA